MQNFERQRRHESNRSFVKMHGLLNHFVITDARESPYQPEIDEIVRVCDPQQGVGADQLIVIEPATNSATGAAAFMRILNVDGREAEACGNATRCVAWLLLEETGEDEVFIETLAGLIRCRRLGEKYVSCSMGTINLEWQKIPLAEERDTLHLQLSFGPLTDGIALSIGNPHVVFFVDDIESIDIQRLAPEIQQHPLFPNQVNVGIAKMVTAKEMDLIVYERGAGLTTACGSGACVAAYAALLRGFTDNNAITVNMPAGSVEIGIDADGQATMSGPLEYCFTGVYQTSRAAMK